MIARITGRLDGVTGLEAIVEADGLGLALAVAVPAYLAERLRERVGEAVTLHTLAYLEAQGPGGAMIPRLIGFASVGERQFFDLLTSVDGLGNRRALRAMAREPREIARAIAGSDAGWLQELPEVGKKTAAKIIFELKARVGPFLEAGDLPGASADRPRVPRVSEQIGAAIDALVALGETRADAERLVERAVSADPTLATADEIVAAAFATGRRAI